MGMKLLPGRVFPLFIVLLLCCAAPTLAGPRVDPVPGLLMSLRAMAPAVSVKAVQALGALKDPRAIGPLVGLLSHLDVKTANTRFGKQNYLQIVLTTLRQFGGKVAAPLGQALAHEQMVRRQQWMIEALAASGDAAAVRPLCDVLRRSAGVRDDAARALQRLGAPGMAALAGLCCEGYDVAGRLLIAAGAGAVPYLQPLIAQAGAAGQRARDALYAIGPAAMPAMLSALQTVDTPARQWGLTALQQWGDSRAFDAVRKCLADANPLISKLAVQALASLQDPRAVDVLIPLLLSPDHGLSMVVIEALGQLGDKRAAGPLIAALGKVSPEAAGAVATALAQIGDVRAIGPLYALSHDVRHPQRIAIICALAVLGDERVADAVIAALQGTDPAVRQSAADALAALRNPKAKSPLLDVALHDPDCLAQARALRALAYTADAQVGNLLSVAWQQEPWKDQLPVMRKWTALALAASGDADALSLLLREARPDQQLAALTALGASTDPRALSALLTAMKSPDARRRVAAAEGLGASHDPQAVSALIDALRDSRQDVRLAAIHSLAALEPKIAMQAVPALITALSDPVPDITRGAMRTLTTLTGQHYGYDTVAWQGWWKGQGK